MTHKRSTTTMQKTAQIPKNLHFTAMHWHAKNNRYLAQPLAGLTSMYKSFHQHFNTI